MENLKEEIISKVLTVDGRVSSTRCKESYLRKIGLYDHIMNYGSEWNKEFHSIRDRVYGIVHDIYEAPKCRVCGTFTHIGNDYKGQGFREFCSKTCHYQGTDFKERFKNVNQKEAQEKREQTMLRKYGFTTNSQRPEIKEVMSRKTSLRYMPESVYDKLRNREFMYDQYHNQGKFIFEIANEMDVDQSTVSAYLTIHRIIKGNHFNKSKIERDLYDYIRNLVDKKYCVVRNTKEIIRSKITNRQLELDVFVPELNVAFEMHGLRWHCGVDRYGNVLPTSTYRNKHKEKYDLCQEQNIELFSIFSDEWEDKNEQVKAFIAARLGIFEKRIYARNCIVRKISNTEAKLFFERNHIQGSGWTLYCAYGLFYDNELVGAVGYAPHQRNNNEMTLRRLAFERGIQIIGGANKLISNSLKIENFESVKTWSDNRWSNGSIYEKCGFQLLQHLPPDYSYVEPGWKRRTSKQMMKDKPENCPKNISEREIAAMHMYFQIFDCGKKSWIWKNSNHKTEITAVLF